MHYSHLKVLKILSCQVCKLALVCCLTGAIQRTVWSPGEILAIQELVKTCQVQKKPPKKSQVTEVQQQNENLKNRDWSNIKFRVWAEVQKKLKTMQKVQRELMA